MCKYHNITVIETPQLEEERKHRSDMVNRLAQYSSTLQPEQIAAEVRLNLLHRKIYRGCKL